ncbi:unnamed protein product [Hymenolepis diminuta]|uniref:Peptidase A2 domain-containing protein n=1 Tax=Hymenolepis diminuta TaxID=6216 RepID=A0A0R3SQR9_HYMDI|nr:unnamed protein product [Hymenolepis diminuta]
MDSIETAKIAAIVRCIMEQMNLSKPDKDQEDYIKNPLQPYKSHRRGRFQNQRRQAHGILTTLQVNVSRRRYVTLCINGRHIELQVDTGSDITIVSAEAWKSLGLPKLDKAPFKASRASDDAVQLSGATK